MKTTVTNPSESALEGLEESLAFLEQEMRREGLEAVSLVLKNTYLEIKAILAGERDGVTFDELRRAIRFFNELPADNAFLKRFVNIISDIEKVRQEAH